MKGLSLKEIKSLAKKRINANGGNCVSLMTFMLAIIIFLIMCELSLYLLFCRLDWEYFFSFEGLRSRRNVQIFWALNLIIAITALTNEMNVIRRLFLDLSKNGNYFATRQYMAAHSFTYFRKSLYNSFILNLIKLFSAVPLAVGIYGVYYWGWICKLSELTSAGLLSFMLSLGFSCVWLGVMIHYWISLALTPYIMALNPRTNIFDACDLSVRLMDGQHGRYIFFMLSFVKFTPTLVFVYPIFVIYPYFEICYIILMEDILGDYWQDKMSGMIKRWRKYSA